MSTIRNIRLDELFNFINSEEYKSLEYIPISTHRAISYINNERAKQDDVVITLLLKNNQIIAYRCLFPDYFFYEDKKYHFAWISGSWVHPEFRRRGYSMKLLTHCYNLYQGRILFSNYAPESKSLYDKSLLFKEIHELKGRRIYFRFCFSELLPPKKRFFSKIKPLLIVIDYLLNLLFDIRFVFQSNKLKFENLRIEEKIDSRCESLIAKRNLKNPFRRNKNEINHAIDYPWVFQKDNPDQEDIRYHFSSESKQFKYKVLNLLGEKQEISAVFLIKIRDNEITIPYYFSDKLKSDEIVKTIYLFIKKYKLSYMTVFDQNIIDNIKKGHMMVLFSKKMYRKFFAGNEIAELFNESSRFFAGDGDNLYT